MSAVNHLFALSKPALMSTLSKNHFKRVAGDFRLFLGAGSRGCKCVWTINLAASLKDVCFPVCNLVLGELQTSLQILPRACPLEERQRPLRL